MRKRILIMLFLVSCQSVVFAQHSNEQAYAKLMQLTKVFHGKEPYSCNAIVEVKYKSGANSLRDTSKLIYRNGSTYYKSKKVEHVEASQGELVINHELKTAVLNVSDSIKQVLQKELGIKADKELEALLDSNFQTNDQQAFYDYVVKNCNASWVSKGALDEISFTPKNTSGALFISMKIRFSKDDKVLYYEYTNREAYAKDLDGRTKYRMVTTIYDNLVYNNVPNIPSKLSDFLEWNGWTIKLKKYTNYKLSVL